MKCQLNKETGIVVLHNEMRELKWTNGVEIADSHPSLGKCS